MLPPLPACIITCSLVSTMASGPCHQEVGSERRARCFGIKGSAYCNSVTMGLAPWRRDRGAGTMGLGPSDGTIRPDHGAGFDSGLFGLVRFSCDALEAKVVSVPIGFRRLFLLGLVDRFAVVRLGSTLLASIGIKL